MSWNIEQERDARAFALKLTKMVRDAGVDDSVTLTALIRATGAILGTSTWDRVEFRENVLQFLMMVRDEAYRARKATVAMSVAEKLDPNNVARKQ